MFEQADIQEVMRFFGCDENAAVAWLKAEWQRIELQEEWEEAYWNATR